MTWAEFVEAGLLREYRRTHRVPMVELRAFIDLLREKFDVPYPLADRRPYVAGRKLVLEAQTAAGLDPDYCLVAVVGDQLLLTPPSAAFVERVTWDGDIATGWRPASDPRSPVRIQPDVRFGRPSIKGISTEAIWEQDDAGLDVDEIAEMYELDVPDGIVTPPQRSGRRDPFDAWHVPQLGQRAFGNGRGTAERNARHVLSQHREDGGDCGFDNGRVGVTEDHRSP